VQGAGYRAQGAGVQGSEFRVQDSGFRAPGSGVRGYTYKALARCGVQGLGFRI
jgi:hypothetical protein